MGAEVGVSQSHGVVGQVQKWVCPKFVVGWVQKWVRPKFVVGQVQKWMCLSHMVECGSLVQNCI